MTIPADSLPGDHLRAEELTEGREALCRYMKENPAPMFTSDSVLSARLEQCLCADAVGSVCLKEQELMSVRGTLCAFIGVGAGQSSSFAERFFERLSNLSRSTFPRMIAACCILLILGNSVAFAANGAMPGDALYPVKINVVEPAVAVVSVTPEAKAKWASDCVKRRLAEVETLIIRRDLESKHWPLLQHSMAKNMNVAVNTIDSLAASDIDTASDLSSDLDTTLAAYDAVLADINESEKISADMLDNVRVAASAASALFLNVETRLSQDEIIMTRNVRKIMDAASSAALQFDRDVENGNSDDIPTHVIERLMTAKSHMENADLHLKNRAFSESFQDARKAVQKVTEGKTYLRMGLKFGTAVSGGNASVRVVPLTVCGATVINVNVPAAAAPAVMHDSSASSLASSESSTSQSTKSDAHSSAALSVSSSHSSVSSVKSSSLSFVTSPSSKTVSIASSAGVSSAQISSTVSVASSTPIIVLPPIIPDIPVLP